MAAVTLNSLSDASIFNIIYFDLISMDQLEIPVRTFFSDYDLDVHFLPQGNDWWRLGKKSIVRGDFFALAIHILRPKAWDRGLE